MAEEEEESKPNPMMFLIPDLLEEILLLLPLRSILKFKTVSKQWRSILESRRFAERRRANNVKKIPQILAVRDHRTDSRFQGDEEVEMVYLQSEAAATRASLTCDGLVCIPVPGWVNVLNPCTGELLRFPSGPNPKNTRRYDSLIFDDIWWDIFPGFWAMGFGKDKVNGSYKVVRMFFDTNQSEILDVNIGEWRKLPNPPYYVEARKKSAYVNGSIYWVQVVSVFKILALDLHTEQFRDVPTPPAPRVPSELVNLKDRLALVKTDVGVSHWEVMIWSMDTQEETWTKTYSICLFPRALCPYTWRLKCRPVAVSKQGNLFFYDNEKRLFKYLPKTNQVHCIAANIRVLSHFVENMVPLRHSNSAPKIMTYPSRHHVSDSWISKCFRRFELPIPNILLTTTVVALVIFRCSVSSRS